MFCFSTTDGKEPSDKEQRKTYIQIQSLYAGLEKLSNLKHDEQNSETLKKQNSDTPLKKLEREFKDFFSEKNSVRNYKILRQDDILLGKITDKHRDDPLPTEKEDNEIDGESLLLRAMCMSVEKQSEQETTLKNIKELLIRSCPWMIYFPKKYKKDKKDKKGKKEDKKGKKEDKKKDKKKNKKNRKFQGITPLHVAILKEDTDLLECMATAVARNKQIIKNVCAKGSAFQSTVMMAGTPLGVAVLKFNRKLFLTVLEQFTSDVGVVNHKGDNIVHSLIKYAHCQPGKINDVLKMLNYVLDCEYLPPDVSLDTKKHKKNVNGYILLMMKNRENLNPLQLAAKRQQFEIFELIMHHKVHCTRESSNGIFNEEVFDITEIETLAIENDVKGDEHEIIKQEYHQSVLEYFIHQQTKNAFLFADFLPVREVIIEKWKHYKLLFRIWFFIHFLFMILLSVTALYRSKLVPSENRGTTYKYPVTVDAFVTSVSIIGCIVGVIYMLLECSRVYLGRFQFRTSSSMLKSVRRHFITPYSNFIFRIYFLLFSLLLICDLILASTAAQNSSVDYQNYCLLFAVILGWYLFIFFLQTSKTFSFFTVLIQRVILDMFKFLFVMAIFLVAFSIAMYMAMQGANTDNDDFENFGKTMMKMLTIMLGIGEIEILFQARQPILAVMVFVLFVLLTTILLLNALIAMMSNSCTDLMSNHSVSGMAATKMHCRLQKLSVILFLESFLPRCMCKEVGVVKREERYENPKRRFWSLSCVHEDKKLHLPLKKWRQNKTAHAENN